MTEKLKKIWKEAVRGVTEELSANFLRAVDNEEKKTRSI
jgi:hypothetical protein